MRLRDTNAAKVTIDLFRMSQWLVLAGALYFVTFDKDIGLQDSNPGLQSTIYTVANITIRAYLGYWIARGVLWRMPRDFPEATDMATSKAIILGFCVLARAVLVGLVIVTSK